ncbi:hypothetical protein PENCOP_c005G03313 [Penicillium coprophilum]|uniref:Uncharacterized protein n=1 Tax=Penicillium coprophilum TaxID=36646 RepID=A0A1V6USG7_9EURO|nr:hypothetical protein PENCOP_c005G03313 [Penicillium coprophilum]
MAGRAPHGTYEQERSHFMTTLHAQIHILKDKDFEGNVKMVINSLDVLLRRVASLRMAGQAHFNFDNSSWTARCNKLHERLEYFIDTLDRDHSSAGRVAREIESMLLLVDFCIPRDTQYKIRPDRGDRSGAPSPEPRP